MKNKKRVIILIFFLVLFIKAVPAQEITPGLNTEELQNDSIVQGVQNLQQFTEENKWEAISQQWKELFLKNKVIGAVDEFFRKINVVFVVLFGRNYDFSFELYFTIILWVIAFLILPKYLLFLKEKWMRYLGSLAIVIALANAQFFNFISVGLFKILFFKYEWYWKAISLLLLLVALVIYIIVLKYFEQIIKKSREKKEENEIKKERAEIKGIARGIEIASNSDEYGQSGYEE